MITERDELLQMVYQFINATYGVAKGDEHPNLGMPRLLRTVVKAEELVGRIEAREAQQREAEEREEGEGE